MHLLRFPYRVGLISRRHSCVVPDDLPSLIRSAVDGEELAWNGRTKSLEVAAEASLAIHPSSSRLAIGMWHLQTAAGVLFSVDIGAEEVM